MKVTEGHRAGLSSRAIELVELVRASPGDMSAAQRAAGLRSLETRLDDRRRASRLVRWSAVAAAAALGSATLGGIVVWRNGQRHAPISFRVEGAELHAGGYIEAGPSVRPALRFSDGSEVLLNEGTRVHVRSIDEHGARVTLDEGKAHVYVVHTQEAHWSFDAGPFVVGVRGTAFALSWTSVERRLDVRLENGSVTVGGPLSDTPIALRAGQWLTVRGGEILIRGLDASESTSNTDSPEALSPPYPSAPATESLPEPASKANPSPRAADRARHAHHVTAAAPVDHHWAADLASGRVASIVEEALRFGLDGTFADSSGDELAALADAARYTRHEDIARDALFTIRHRFPGSVHANDAAFLLGRLAETQQDSRGALSWFETYLSEAPNGAYASEALGRKMTVVQRLEGNDAARPVAESYLRRFPSGTYARAAEALNVAR